MLRTTPPDASAPLPERGVPVSFSSPGVPPGEDGIANGREYENEAARKAENDDGGVYEPSSEDHDFLQMVRVAEQQAQLYTAQVNRRAWSQSYRAFHNEHFVGSKYTRPEYRGRSRLFVPKTLSALRKDLAAVAASMFNNVDAISCKAG